MSNALGELPNPTDFGTTFNYNVWTPNTQIQLSNVPWNNDYRDVVEYETNAALDAFLDASAGPRITLGKLTYARMGDPIRINLTFNQVMQYNYLRVSNGIQPVTAHYSDKFGVNQTKTDTSKSYYYFITDVRYIAPNTTEITVQLDVWQTFRRQVSVGTAFVERGHVGIANSLNFTNYGRDYLTTPEGFDIGNEYAITESYSYEIADSTVAGKNPWIMLGTTVDFMSDPGTVDDPKLNSANGGSIEGLPQGIDVYFFKELTEYRRVISAFRKVPWVTQGIQFVIAIPNLDDEMDKFEPITIDGPDDGPAQAYYMSALKLSTEEPNLKTAWRDTAINNLPVRYRHLKKFLTYPYTVLELTTYTGQPLMLKPELMNSGDLRASIYRHLTPPMVRWTVMPQFYNVPLGSTQEDGEFFDVATHITNFPRLCVLNDQYINYMASYRNRINYDYSSADWSQQRALAGNEASFNNTSRSLGAANASVDAQVNAMQQNTGLANNMAQANAMIGVAGAALNGASAGPAGMAGNALKSGIMGGANAAAQTYQNNEQLAINRNLARTQQGIAYGAGAGIRDTNKAYADFAANGDYANAIAGINARVQDAKMLQPSISGQMDGESFMMSTGSGLKVVYKVKQPNMAAIITIGDYWLRYGYSVNRFFRFTGTGVPNLNCMTKFTYWKMREVVLKQSYIPENFKQTIRGILEKGVTVWQDATDIGVTDIGDNDPLTGIAY